jgi:Ca2+-binding EF-hand superfamily protein
MWQDLVSGLDGVMFNDLMENIEWFFNLHDKNKDGYLSKDEVLTLSESFLVRRSSLSLNAVLRLTAQVVYLQV